MRCDETAQGAVATVEECLDVAAGQRFGQFVSYLHTQGGLMLSTTFGSDFAGLGYDNAPPAGDGSCGDYLLDAASALAGLISSCSDAAAQGLCGHALAQMGCAASCKHVKAQAADSVVAAPQRAEKDKRG